MWFYLCFTFKTYEESFILLLFFFNCLLGLNTLVFQDVAECQQHLQTKSVQSAFILLSMYQTVNRCHLLLA